MMSLQKIDGFEILVNYLSDLDINLYTGVTGGGVVHFLKHINGYPSKKHSPVFFTLGEYAAGFVPIGSYIATGNIAAAVATTGAATKLLACGLSDAKLHDIPSIYIFPISSNKHKIDCALQDSSIYGNNIVKQLEAELPNQVFILSDPSLFSQQLAAAYQLLVSRKPIVFILDNDVLTKQYDIALSIPSITAQPKEDDINKFVAHFKQNITHKRVILIVGEQAMHNPNIKSLITKLCQNLKAAVLWSMNGVNCIESDNPYGYGCISFGGNDHALALWNAINQDDIVLAIGLCPDEYTTNLQKIKASTTYFITELSDSYGQIQGTYKHHALYESEQITAPIDQTLQALVKVTENTELTNIPLPIAPKNLNTRKIKAPAVGYADMDQFYQRLHRWWQPNSIVITDVCLTYKDYQYVNPKPNNNITYFSCYRGSAMGGAYGIAVGAKLASPEKNVFVFSGDGCFRLYGSCLTEAKDLGIVLFIIDNNTYSIVGQGLPAIIPDVKKDKYHDQLQKVDYCAIAKASGWLSYSLSSDLSNLESILDQIDKNKSHSILINVPCDPNQVLGENPRSHNL
ncbi:thiamine pyrophosphate-dependent enzyme [Orbus sturtevantii]|uniref:thiamine pyrophosphate-dependent enzyme n=1 Tax=Orbus sturtevantii TaxID=3074109 RepID=UPI00370DD9C6